MGNILEIIDNMSIREVELGTIINLFLAFVCGIGIFTVYSITNRKPSVNHSFSYTLILLPLVSFMIAVIVSSNFVLAVSMLGALSIIRFRHSVKESKNLVFIFWAVTAGLTSGVNLRTLTIIWCGLIGVITIIIYFISERRHSAVLTVKTIGRSDEIESILKDCSLRYELKYRKNSGVTNILFELKGKQAIADATDTACERIAQLNGVSSVKLVKLQ